MTDRTYKIGKWYGWTGGECPVPECSRVKIKLSDGSEPDTETESTAGNLFWDSDSEMYDHIVAFCVTEYPDEVVTECRDITVHDHTLNDVFFVDATCTYRNGKLVEVHWKDESALQSTTTKEEE